MSCRKVSNVAIKWVWNLLQCWLLVWLAKVGTPWISGLFKWKGKAVVESTWEEEFTAWSQFPKFRLKDKSDFQGGVIDRSLIREWWPKLSTFISAEWPHCWEELEESRKEEWGGREREREGEVWLLAVEFGYRKFGERGKDNIILGRIIFWVREFSSL